MKTLTFAVLFALGHSALSSAQTAAVSRVEGGFKAGTSLASISPYDSADDNEAFGTEPRAGATAGGFVTIRISNQFAFQAELLYVQKGATLTDPRNGAAVVRTRLNYLEMPLLLRWDFHGARVAPYVLAGPAVAWTLSAHVDASPSGGASDIDVKDETQTADFGIAAGGGVGFGRVFVEGRLVQGLLDIGNSLRVDRVVRTRTVSIVVGARF